MSYNALRTFKSFAICQHDLYPPLYFDVDSFVTRAEHSGFYETHDHHFYCLFEEDDIFTLSKNRLWIFVSSMASFPSSFLHI